MMDRSGKLKLLLHDTFDLLVIGGGATGAGIALDATLRGFKTALIEASDFSSGSSSRSTKLLHGGIRYLEKAFHHFDWNQLRLVRDSLQERSILMQLAPHLTNAIPIVLPVYSSYKKLYYWIGLNIYEWLSGQYGIGACKKLDVGEVLRLLPGLSSQGLVGGISYVDGQFDDARFNIALVQTAAEKGCVALNYVRCDGLIKSAGAVRGAQVTDLCGGSAGEVRAKVVVNAAGCFADSIRLMDAPAAAPLLAPSRGSHIVLKKSSLPITAGFIFPGTSDGRVVFGLPWEGEILIGTTDLPTLAEFHPQPTEDEITYLLDHVGRHFSIQLARHDVVAAWTGIRPLYKGTGTAETSSLSRDHYIERSASGLYTIVGGKWTTYRLMAKDMLDLIIADGVLSARGVCMTGSTKLSGSESYSPQLADEIAKSDGLPIDIAQHLVRAYGGKARDVVCCMNQGYSKRLHEGFPYVEAEAVYARQHEFAVNAEDVLYRRLRLGFLDDRIVKTLERRVDEIMGLC